MSDSTNNTYTLLQACEDAVALWTIIDKIFDSKADPRDIFSVKRKANDLLELDISPDDAYCPYCKYAKLVTSSDPYETDYEENFCNACPGKEHFLCGESDEDDWKTVAVYCHSEQSPYRNTFREYNREAHSMLELTKQVLKENT